MCQNGHLEGLHRKVEVQWPLLKSDFTLLFVPEFVDISLIKGQMGLNLAVL